jgi:DEAD/DEAH box helicase domain-containing protein
VVMCILGNADDIDVDALPWGEEDTVPAGIETVVEAEPVRMARGKLVQGVLIKNEEEEDEFSRSIQMFGGERTFIGVHR